MTRTLSLAGLLAGAWLGLVTPVLAAPSLPGGIIRDLHGLEQRLQADAAGEVRGRALAQAERLAGGNAADRWARALYLQLAAGAEARLGNARAAADHLASARATEGVEAAQADRWLRQEVGLRLEAGQAEEARGLLADWLSRHGGAADDHWRMARLLAAETNWEAAARWVRRALEAGGEPVGTQASLAASVLQRAGDEASALAVLERRLENAEDDPEAWRRAAGLAQRLGDPGRAAALWEAGWRRGVLTGRDDLRQRIRLHLAGGTPARAAELLATALEEGTLADDPANRRLLARAWQAARDRERALAAWEALAERSGAGEDWLHLGQLAHGWGEWALAERALERALALGEAGAEAWLASLPEGQGDGAGETGSTTPQQSSSAHTGA
ncbi:hypothetical protein [Halomonas stenophila]|uniref:Tetratricopeptide repeat protein n=1 Tax=Halomonas stenophila TaxID=795312 RepID=A0A7W5HLL3_9GAMM|nr:hypothetical protein [Halomonas stenophila]MBB3231642.1 hypothetical protein [Halomonas stenophila]